MTVSPTLSAPRPSAVSHKSNTFFGVHSRECVTPANLAVRRVVPRRDHAHHAPTARLEEHAEATCVPPSIETEAFTRSFLKLLSQERERERERETTRAREASLTTQRRWVLGRGPCASRLRKISTTGPFGTGGSTAAPRSAGAGACALIRKANITSDPTIGFPCARFQISRNTQTCAGAGPPEAKRSSTRGYRTWNAASSMGAEKSKMRNHT